GTVEGLRAAIQVDPSNARVTAHLGQRLADYSLKQDTDPDEARRARGEADFLTSRALKLAPDNDEVKRLRDEVVKLLGLKTSCAETDRLLLHSESAFKAEMDLTGQGSQRALTQ